MKKLILLLLFGWQLSAQTPERPSPDEGVPVTELADPQTLQTRPEYPGGINEFYKYIAKNVQTPDDGEFKGGRVMASFVIEKDGTLSNIRIESDTAGFGVAKEVIRVLKASPRWEAGVQNGKKVRVQYRIPVQLAVR
jgi:hypothetical protein